jgi:YidC/Oxa1 family membrane protein insertase
MEMESKLIAFLILSSVIFFGWWYIQSRLSRGPADQVSVPVSMVAPAPGQTSTPAPTNRPTDRPTDRVDNTHAPTPVTPAEARHIKIRTDHWTATMSNRGAVITEWTMTSLPNGKPIDPPNGVNLISASLSRSVGAALRFSIPSDPILEKELNSALYEIKNLPEEEIFLNKGAKREVSFTYSNNGVEANKTIILKGEGYEGATGFEFDIQADVKRNGNPVVTYVVIGPNFGDQSVKEVNVYSHAPQLTYEIGGRAHRDNADTLKNSLIAPTPSSVTWAAVDDNYFAMTFVPPKAAPAIRFLNDRYVSIAVLVNQGDVSHIYAGPKDLNLLSRISESFGLARNGGDLADIVSYSWLDYIGISFIIKPIAKYMLTALRFINRLTNNFGWSIVVFTVVLNMFLFPLRWKSSVAMRRAAALQPRLKDLQERMKNLEKDDPRMLDLQREQLALIKEGNPLIGCLPMALQAPVLMTFYAVLLVSIEVRHAPFIGWIQDLSAPDPYLALPLLMGATMIAQFALTSTTADPVQKKVNYIMPIIFILFMKSAPAGLVLYWMVSNLVGVAQQFVINRLNPVLVNLQPR